MRFHGHIVEARELLESVEYHLGEAYEEALNEGAHTAADRIFKLGAEAEKLKEALCREQTKHEHD